LHGRNRRSLKRIGVLAFAMVIALGAMGVGYAAWTDSVYLEGTVYTGSLDINIIGCSSTFVYKTPEDEIEIYYVTEQDQPTPLPGILVAWAETEFVNGNDDPDTATINFGGLFPEVDFQADLQLQYFGTIPAKVEIAEIFPANDDADPDKDTKDAILAALWTLGEATKGDTTRYGAWVDGELTHFPSGPTEKINDPLGLQLHEQDTVHVTLHVCLPQNPPAGFGYTKEDLMNLTNLKFTGNITVIQWNEYEEP